MVRLSFYLLSRNKQKVHHNLKNPHTIYWGFNIPKKFLIFLLLFSFSIHQPYVNGVNFDKNWQQCPHMKNKLFKKSWTHNYLICHILKRNHFLFATLEHLFTRTTSFSISLPKRLSFVHLLEFHLWKGLSSLLSEFFFWFFRYLGC